MDLIVDLQQIAVIGFRCASRDKFLDPVSDIVLVTHTLIIINSLEYTFLFELYILHLL